MRVRSIVLSATVVTGLFYGVVGAGDLNPPAGAVAPTMKTLEQVEPRTPIEALPFTIDSPGSYYLTGNLSTAGNGIDVIVSDVTIDLMGFTITGSGPGANTGIRIFSLGNDNVTIRNGTVRSFLNGITANNDATSVGFTIEDIRVLDVGVFGMEILGKGHLISNCHVQRADQPGNSFFQTGILAQNSVITGCRVSGEFTVGISASNGSVVTDSVVTGSHTGIVCSGGLVNGCVATGNLAQNLTLNGGAISVDTYAP